MSENHTPDLNDRFDVKLDADAAPGNALVPLAELLVRVVQAEQRCAQAEREPRSGESQASVEEGGRSGLALHLLSSPPPP